MRPVSYFYVLPGAMDWPEFFVSVAVAFVAGFAFEALLEKIGG